MQYVTNQKPKVFPVWLFGQALYWNKVVDENSLAEYLRGYSFCGVNGHTIWTEHSGSGSRLAHLPFYYSYGLTTYKGLSREAPKVCYSPTGLSMEEADENDALVYISPRKTKDTNTYIDVQYIYFGYSENTASRSVVCSINPSPVLTTLDVGVNSSTGSGVDIPFIKGTFTLSSYTTGTPSASSMGIGGDTDRNVRYATVYSDIIVRNSPVLDIPKNDQIRKLTRYDILDPNVRSSAGKVDSLYFSVYGKNPTPNGTTYARAPATDPMFVAFIEDGVFKRFTLPDNRVTLQPTRYTSGVENKKSVLFTASINIATKQIEI